MPSRASKAFTIQFELAEEGGYTVTVPELPGCITEGNTFSEALDMAKDAIAGWLHVASQCGDPIPKAFEDVAKETALHVT